MGDNTVADLFIFLSTLPARGATVATVWPRPSVMISIHAPREGSDWRHLLRRPG